MIPSHSTSSLIRLPFKIAGSICKIEPAVKTQERWEYLLSLVALRFFPLHLFQSQYQPDRCANGKRQQDVLNDFKLRSRRWWKLRRSRLRGLRQAGSAGCVCLGVLGMNGNNRAYNTYHQTQTEGYTGDFCSCIQGRSHLENINFL